MWYTAAKYSTQDKAGIVYKKIETMLRASDGDFSVFRVMLNNVWHVVLIGIKPPEGLYRRCTHALALEQGIATSIPPDAYRALELRRNQRVRDAVPIQGSTSTWSETHIPHRIASDGNVIPVNPHDIPGYIVETPAATSDQRDQRTHQQRPATSETSSPLQAGTPVHIRSIPFIIAYQDISAMSGNALVQKALDLNAVNLVDQSQATLAANAINAFNAEKLKVADKYLFTPSAIALHTAVHAAGVSEWIQPDNHIWIEVQQPIQTPYGTDIRAIYVNSAYPIADMLRVLQRPAYQNSDITSTMLETYIVHKYHWSLEIINTRCETIYDLTYDIQQRKWIYLASHICPTGHCTYRQPDIRDIVTGRSLGHCTPCTACIEATAYWSSWLYTAMCIIRRDYALTPEPDNSPYPIDQQPYQVDTMTTVGHGKNKRTVKQTVTRQVNYRLVTFDVTSSDHHQRPLTSHTDDVRANWLTMHGKEERIYKKHHYTGLVRRYEGYHYRRLIQRCLQDGSFTEEGKTYTLERTDKGEYAVVSKVADHDRYIPMLRPEVRKSVTIKQVIAPDYQEGRTHNGTPVHL